MIHSGVVFNKIYQYTVRLSPSITLFVISGFALLVSGSLATALKVFERKVEREGYEELEH